MPAAVVFPDLARESRGSGHSFFPFTTHCLLLALCLTLWWPAARAGEPVPVQAVPFGRLAIHPERSVPATVLSLNDSELAAELRATVIDIPVRVGDRVSAGDLLAKLDCREYRLALQEAEANLRAARARLALARRQLERARSLQDQRNISEELLNQRQTELEVAGTEADRARVQRDRAALDVSRCDLKAPFDGIVVERLGDVGELASVGSPMVRLVDSTRLEVSARIPVDAMAGLEQAGEIWLEAGGGRFPLALRAVTPVVEPSARSVEARFLFGAQEKALAGAAGRVVWRAVQPHVPADLLVRRNGRLGVFVVEAGEARFVPVPDAREGQPARLELDPKTRVVTEGRFGLNDGDPVRVMTGSD